jgi:single-strand DNA-binding protein
VAVPLLVRLAETARRKRERNVNSITISGRVVGRDAAPRQAGGETVVQFCVGDNRKVKGEWITTFFDVSIWGKRGEALLPMLRKGTNVVVIGELQTPVVKGEKCYLSVRCNDINVIKEASIAQEEHLPF